MRFLRPLLASAALLSFSPTINAAVPHRRAGLANENVLQEGTLERPGLFQRWSIPKPFQKRQDSADLICTPGDTYWDILTKADHDDTQIVCNKLLRMPPATTVIEETPVFTREALNATTSTTTETTRVIVTTTETATESPARLSHRAANLAAKQAEANNLFTSLAVDPMATPSPTNSQREEAVSGFITACSCLDIDPTSTVIVTFTAPPQPITVNKLRKALKTDMVTKVYTATTTVVVTSNQTASEVPPSSNSTTIDPQVSVITSSVEPIQSLPPGTIRPVVIGIPFDCPSNQDNRTSFIVNDDRWEFLVICETSVVTDTEIFTVEAADATECAEICSVVNGALSGACRAATFSAAPGTTRGDCLISGPTDVFVNKPGSVTVLLTGVTSAGDNCTSVDTTPSLNGTAVDTSSIIASITSAGVSLSTPGFVTGSANGGAKETFVSSGYTDSFGAYHYSWYYLSESSSYWWAVYATSWTCTNNIPRTIVVQQPVTDIANVTSVYYDVTTIVNGGVITVISGSSTSTFTAGNGAATPSSIPALTTSGNGAFTTSGFTATNTGAYGGGVVAPTVTAVSSGAISSQVGINGTGLALSGTAIEGSGAVTVSSLAFAATSIGGGGIISPSSNATAVESVTSGGAQLVVSGGTAIFNFTAGGGYGPPTASLPEVAPAISTGVFATAISGGAQLSVSGGIFTANGTAGGGVIYPTGGSGVAPPITVTVTSEITVNITFAQSATGGSFVGTLSGGMNTANFTGGAGGGGPSSSISPSLNGTLSASAFPTGGAANISIFGGTATFLSTGAGGVISPSANASGTASSSPKASSTSPVTRKLLFAIPIPVATTFSTAGGGVISPTRNSSTAAPASATASASFNASATTGNGALNLTVSGATAVTYATEGGGVIYPSSSISANFTSTLGTGQPSITVPPVSANSSSALPTNTSGFEFSDTNNPRRGSFSRSSTLPLPTGYPAPSSAVPSISANSSVAGPFGTGNLTEAPSVTPTVSLNATIPSSLITGNVSIPSITPSTSLNATSEACPTATSYSTSIEIITHLIPIAPSTCLSPTPASATGNETFLSGTGGPALPTYSTTTLIISLPTDLAFRRLANATATQDQITAACADTSNMVFNSGFEDQIDNNAIGWTVQPDDSFISFRTYPNNETADNQRSGRVLSAAPGRSITISQPLTLCPGKQYQLSSSNRQTDLLAQCTNTYSIGDKEIYTASPQEGWLTKQEFYTAGDSTDDVSVDLKIRVSCAGLGGALVGTTDDGYMVSEFDNVSLVQV